MTAVNDFGCEKSGVQIQYFLACLNCEKQLKTKYLIKTCIILILKFVLKEHG